MNPNNYASLAASKRLVEAGIVLETEVVWASKEGCPYSLVSTTDVGKIGGLYIIPAPSMAEVWRELPCWLEGYRSLMITKSAGDELVCGYQKGLAVRDPMRRSINPTDALIDLLIWVRKEASHA